MPNEQLRQAVMEAVRQGSSIDPRGFIERPERTFSPQQKATLGRLSGMFSEAGITPNLPIATAEATFPENVQADHLKRQLAGLLAQLPSLPTGLRNGR